MYAKGYGRYQQQDEMTLSSKATVLPHELASLPMLPARREGAIRCRINPAIGPHFCDQQISKDPKGYQTTGIEPTVSIKVYKHKVIVNLGLTTLCSEIRF
jgi:hypothetical protein